MEGQGPYPNISGGMAIVHYSCVSVGCDLYESSHHTSMRPNATSSFVLALYLPGLW